MAAVQQQDLTVRTCAQRCQPSAEATLNRPASPTTPVCRLLWGLTVEN
jgi:hypothetical protein